MRAPGGEPRGRDPSEAIEFVPKEELDQAQRQIERQRQRIERLQRENERLRKELEAALRASKRQAAPHSRGAPKRNPKRPGRKPGRQYGRQACRPVPPRIDEQIELPLPEHCPHCGGGVAFESRQAQYQEEIVRRTLVRRFDIAVGCCHGCGRRVQGRHPLQTSDAVGVGGVQLGPEALTLAAILNKQMGLSLGHTRQVLAHGFGLPVSRGGLYRALARMSEQAAPTYAESAQVTVYAILPGRGYQQSVVILGAGWEGFLIHDGWAPYYRFAQAFHQSCVSHLLARCKQMAQIASPAAARFPLAVKNLLQRSLRLRDRYQGGEISEHGLRRATGRLEANLDRLLDRHYRHAANRRLARHLEHERPALFSFLYCPGLDATNNAAERALRGMVIARKVWGGNRTWAGARTQQILVSVLRTCWRQDKDPFCRWVGLLRSPGGQTLDIVSRAD